MVDLATISSVNFGGEKSSIVIIVSSTHLLRIVSYIHMFSAAFRIGLLVTPLFRRNTAYNQEIIIKEPSCT